jgi:hypothetical protein
MRKAVMLAFVTLCLWDFSPPARACGAGSKETEPGVLVRNTEIIVRARAVGYGDPTPPDSRIRFIEFRVEEVLKGDGVPAAFLIRGILTESDDYNDRPAPYDLVRPAGRSGSCWAYHYKQGADFLLFLKRHDPNEEDSQEWGDITPYWASMAATNEQLRPVDDAWLRWVKAYLTDSSSMKEKAGTFSPHDTPGGGGGVPRP